MVRVYLKWEKIIKTKEEENMENKKAFGHVLAIFTIFIVDYESAPPAI